MMRRDRRDADHEDRPRRPAAAGLAPLWIVTVVLGTVLVAGGLAVGYFLFAREMSKPPTQPTVVIPTQPVKPVADTVVPIVRLSNLKKPTATRTLQVDYTVVDEEEVAGAELYLVAKSKEGTAQMRFTPNSKGRDTITVGREADFRGFGGETQLWVEKQLPGGARNRVSNIVRVYY